MWQPSFNRAPSDCVWEARSLPAKSTKFWTTIGICKLTILDQRKHLYKKESCKVIFEWITNPTYQAGDQSIREACILYSGRTFHRLPCSCRQRSVWCLLKQWTTYELDTSIQSVSAQITEELSLLTGEHGLVHTNLMIWWDLEEVSFSDVSPTCRWAETNIQGKHLWLQNQLRRSAVRIEHSKETADFRSLLIICCYHLRRWR